MTNHLVPCPSCGGLFPDIDGPTHRYIASSPGCWAAHGEVAARHYSDMIYADVYRLAVDAYAVQHPGEPSQQAIRSVGLHLARLCLAFEHQLAPEWANEGMLALQAAKDRFFWLTPPASLGPVTVADVMATTAVEAHKAVVREWARTAYLAWAGHHATIREWIDGAWPPRTQEDLARRNG